MKHDFIKKFWSYIENDRYAIGCTGQTVYVYDKNGTELVNFTDLPYAYKAAFSPCGNIFVVKTTEGRLAVYSLETLSLVKKFRYSDITYLQDDGFCFSADGKYFINIERHIDTSTSAISVYDTEDFSIQSQLLLHKRIVISQIELTNGEYYVLGLMRAEDTKTDCIVGKFANNNLKDIRFITEQEKWFYENYLDLKIMGFTEKAYDWHEFQTELLQLKSINLSLANLWKQNLPIN